jgi:hypothetical protein
MTFSITELFWYALASGFEFTVSVFVVESQLSPVLSQTGASAHAVAAVSTHTSNVMAALEINLMIGRFCLFFFIFSLFLVYPCFIVAPSYVPMVLSVASLCESGRAERQATKGRSVKGLKIFVVSCCLEKHLGIPCLFQGKPRRLVVVSFGFCIGEGDYRFFPLPKTSSLSQFQVLAERTSRFHDILGHILRVLRTML